MVSLDSLGSGLLFMRVLVVFVLVLASFLDGFFKTLDPGRFMGMLGVFGGFGGFAALLGVFAGDLGGFDGALGALGGFGGFGCLGVNEAGVERTGCFSFALGVSLAASSAMTNTQIKNMDSCWTQAEKNTCKPEA